MFLNSLKQLFRRPGKALVFFLLMAASTALLSFAAVSMTETNQRIDAAESQFSTIATVSQNLQPGDEYLHAGILEFDGAEYITPPETRPLLMSYNGGIHATNEQAQYDSVHVMSFTVLENLENGFVTARVERSLFDKLDAQQVSMFGTTEKDLEKGDIITVAGDSAGTVLETGKTYIASCFFDFTAHSHDEPEYYTPYFRPFSTQRTADGQLAEGAVDMALSMRDLMRVEEVTEGFWDEGGRGKAWESWAEALEYERYTSPIPVIPTNRLTLLPSFHGNQAYISSGREITEEEYAQGARVCVLPQSLMTRNFLSVGEKIRLPMRCALYGYTTGRFQTFHFNFVYDFTPLNAHGELYDVFFDEEYEIVGEYRTLQELGGDLVYDAIIVPRDSVTVGWEDNIAYYKSMNAMNTSFQIENGKIAEFNTALHNAVPEASRLEIVYDDNGYEEIMQSLKNARLSAVLLLAVGALAALTVIVLLMYFFVVKERKRTAIERSLGLSKRQCRVSLISGILALALPAVVLGSWASWMMGNVEFEEKQSQAAGMSSGIEPEVEDMSVSAPDESIETTYFSRDYSLWAENENSEADIVLDETALAVQKVLYFAVPGAVFICVALLALVMVNGNLRVEPILLMGGQAE